MIGKENKKSWTWMHTNSDVNKTIWITTYWKTGTQPIVSPFDNYKAADICAKYYKKQGYEVCVDECTVFHKCIDFEAENEESKYDIKELYRRVENIEKQMKEDKEEQLKNLQAELDYAKFNNAYLERQLHESNGQQLKNLQEKVDYAKFRCNL